MLTRHRSSPLNLLLMLALILGAGLLSAQELQKQPTPFSVWLDFRQLVKGTPRKAGLPIWIESVERVSAMANRTMIRIRLRRVGALNEQLQFRLFFHDTPNALPNVTGWTETGSQPFVSGALGQGLDMDSSESLSIPTADLDYIDVEVAGDGSNLRGAFLTSLRKQPVWHSLDFAPPPNVNDPFGRDAPADPAENDSLLFGRVQATIDTAPLKLVPPGQIDGAYEFSLQSAPLLAAATFEVLGASPLEPILVFTNGNYSGLLTVGFPDLADPGYIGISSPLERDLRFRYTGWLRGQIIIPGSQLVGGLNSLILRVNEHSAPIVLRAVEIQLKYPSPVFDYQLNP